MSVCLFLQLSSLCFRMISLEFPRAEAVPKTSVFFPSTETRACKADKRDSMHVPVGCVQQCLHVGKPGKNTALLPPGWEFAELDTTSEPWTLCGDNSRNWAAALARKEANSSYFAFQSEQGAGDGDGKDPSRAGFDAWHPAPRQHPQPRCSPTVTHNKRF